MDLKITLTLEFSHEIQQPKGEEVPALCLHKEFIGSRLEKAVDVQFDVFHHASQRDHGRTTANEATR